MKTAAIVLAAQAALVASAAHAQSVDVAKISCDQFLFDRIAPTKSIAVWLTGYYNGLLNNTVLDLDQMERSIDKVEDYCRLNLSMPLMDAAKKALGK